MKNQANTFVSMALKVCRAENESAATRDRSLKMARNAACGCLHHARHRAQVNCRDDGPEDAQLQSVRLFYHFDPGARTQAEPAPKPLPETEVK